MKKSIRKVVTASLAPLVIALVTSSVSHTASAGDVPRGYTLIQVSYDKADGVPLPIQFWAESGHRYSPTETRLPPRTDAETWLHLERRGQFISCRAKMRVSNHRSKSTRKRTPWVATELEFLGPGGELLHSDIISTSMRFREKRMTEWESCTFTLPPDQILVGVRLRHRAF
jgi:hypothetical protein